jgi:oligopeptide/dipeptide ABC transporter ATP-binding protein
MTALLEVEGLRVKLPTAQGMLTIIDGIDFAVEEGRILGLAGESGSGKTLSALAILQILPARSIIEGRIVYRGREIQALTGKEMRKIRGREVGMVFQDPTTSLHPMLPIKTILTEHLRSHFRVSKRDANSRAIEVLQQVGLPDPEGSLDAYPHQFSGGMRQRVAIAAALICRPKLLIADEPTTALDVTVQAGIISLIERLRKEESLAVILITHDLGILSAAAQSVCVMYAGQIVEVGTTKSVIARPRHPYTRGLLDALPRPDAEHKSALVPISGSAPKVEDRIPGCTFHPRCQYALKECASVRQTLVEVGDGRYLACRPDPLR